MLQKIRIQPGFNKQVTATGGEGHWVAGDYVRFRYGSPEKIGGWAQLGDITLTGRNTALHHFVNASGYFNTTSAIDAVQFDVDSGNIQTGDICLYGIK